ncbi:MAG: ABC transporter permease [Candidatus Hermodarchaeota archaeon]
MMGKAITISGVFIYLRLIQEPFRNRSKRWWIILGVIMGSTLAIVASLIILAARSNSGLGIPVVVGTILFGVSMLVASLFRTLLIRKGTLSPRMGTVFLIGVTCLLGVITIPVSIFILPFAWVDLWTVFVMGGAAIGIILLFLFFGYSWLKERSSPGFLAISGFLMVLAIIYMTVISYWIVPYDPFTLNVGPILFPPSPGYPLGTTSLGQDLLSRTIAGGAIMLQVAFISVLVCFFVGVPLGLLASFRGGILDRILSLVMDSVFAFPGLILAIAIAAMLGPGVVNMALAIAVVYVPSYFRVLRSQVLSIKELPYVEAAVALGARDRDTMFRYVLPNALPSIVVVMSINFADAVLTAAGLTFVGLGLPIDVADWGWDLSFGWRQLITGAWWVITFPGIMIVLLALGFTLVGEGMNEILSPRLKD